jgi:hypothetical protein
VNSAIVGIAATIIKYKAIRTVGSDHGNSKYAAITSGATVGRVNTSSQSTIAKVTILSKS